MLQIGIIGLGLLGSAIAQRLLDGGYIVFGFDIDPERCKSLVKSGARISHSLADIVQRCDLIVLAVFDTDQVIDVVENGIVPNIDHNSAKTVLCASTCDPDRIAALALRAEVRGLYLLESCVSGTSAQVRQGKGVGLISGNSDKVNEVTDVIAAIVPGHFYMGRIGNAGRAKLAINLILGLNRLALAEGLVFAQRMGLDAAHFLDVARKAASYSQVMDTKGPKMVRGDFSPEGRARQSLKDVKLMLDQARKLGQQLPLAALNEEILEACIRNGEGDDDNSVVIHEIQRRISPRVC